MPQTKVPQQGAKDEMGFTPEPPNLSPLRAKGFSKNAEEALFDTAVRNERIPPTSNEVTGLMTACQATDRLKSGTLAPLPERV